MKLEFAKATLHEQLGKGGSGCQVYRCTVRGLSCAVKLMPITNVVPELLSEFCEEINLIEQLSADAERNHLVQYLFHDFEQDHLRLFMEYVPNTLENLLRSRQDQLLGVPTIITILCGLAKGLVYLHSRSPPIIHRDIKAANVFVSEVNGEIKTVKIGDFGTSKTLITNRARSTSASVVTGTPGFMAPEILTSKQEIPYTYATDAFAFGMVVYEILSRYQTPFWQLSFPDSFIEAGNIPELPTSLEPSQYQPFINLFHQCTSFDPKKRPTMLEVLHFLVGLTL